MATMGPHDPFVTALMKALGLPENVVLFELRCEVGQPVMVHCVHLAPRTDGMPEFDRLLKDYKLVADDDQCAGG